MSLKVKFALIFCNLLVLVESVRTSGDDGSEEGFLEYRVFALKVRMHVTEYLSITLSHRAFEGWDPQSRGV